MDTGVKPAYDELGFETATIVPPGRPNFEGSP